MIPKNLFAVSLSLLVAGCAADMGAAIDTARYVTFGAPAPDPSSLNPAYEYLRTVAPLGVGFVARGYAEDHPGGVIETWYSRDREALRIQNGRVVGFVGARAEWRNVVHPDLPSWKSLAKPGATYTWHRTRDVMPGYRYGVRDALALRVIPAPRKSNLVAQDAAMFTWFEERQIDSTGSSDDRLPPTIYAVDLTAGAGIVVYSEVCISPELCFSWQRWRNVSR